MFIVADEAAGHIRRQGGFARAGQTEENRAVLLIAHVGGAVHRHNAFLRQEEVHYREQGFLIFAAVFGADNQDNLLFKVNQNSGFASGAVGGGVHFHFGEADKRKFRHKRF